MLKKQLKQCDVCGLPGIRQRHITRSYGKGKDLIIIENVPVMMCPHCGEDYLMPETIDEIERIKLHRRHFAATRSVAVAAFTA